MVEQISLSLEETNNIRISLGLKPILETESKPLSKVNNNTNKDGDVYATTPDMAVISVPQSTKSKRAISESKDDQHWLSEIKQKPEVRRRFKRAKGNYEDEFLEDMPMFRLNHSISEFKDSSDAILTLKETELDDDDDNALDILENQSLAQEKIDSKNIELRKMNKTRRRNKAILNISSIDVDEDEKVSEADTLLTVGARTIIKDYDAEDDVASLDGKIKVDLNKNSAETNEDSDYKTVKIKTRKKRGKNLDTQIKKSLLPASIEKVILKDEDVVLDDNDDEFDVLIKPMNRKTENFEVGELNIKKRKRIDSKQEEKLDRSNLDGLAVNDTMNFDETANFLESLKANTSDKNVEITHDKIIESDNLQPPGLSITVEKAAKVEAAVPKEEESPDFYYGIATTLNYLKAKNLIPKFELYSKEEIFSMPLKFTEVAKLKENFAKHLPITKNHENNQSAESSDKKNSENLKLYNPEINIGYKDKDGNLLTTKEAYKQLSQKFHKTKSNKEKLAKAKKKIEARNRKLQITGVFDVND